MPRKPTWKQATVHLLGELGRHGWMVRDDVKIPWAISPSHHTRLWFRNGTVYVTHKDVLLGSPVASLKWSESKALPVAIQGLDYETLVRYVRREGERQLTEAVDQMLWRHGALW